MKPDNPQISTELSRELSLFHITMMGLGMMIGAGVFLGIGNAIYVAGPGGVLLTFSLNGVIAIFTALSYAELSSAIPRAGGAYNFARLAFGRGTSFIAGWMEWFASSVAGSLYAVTFAIYTVRYFQGLKLLDWVPFDTYYTEKIVALLIASFFMYINYRGASEAGKVGAFFTLGQTLFLVFIGIVGVVRAIQDPSLVQNLDPFLPYGWSKVLITMGFTYVAFEGYEVIAQAGDETIDPKRNLPKAMIYSVFIVTVTYVAVTFASLVAVKIGSPGVEGAPWEWIGQFKEKGFGEAVSRLMPYGNFFLTLAVIFASVSALNATIYSATRASYALGRDRMLPKFFSYISKKQKTPWVALLFTAGIVISVAVLLPTMDVASSASIMFLLLFFLVNVSVIKIRFNMGDELSYGFIMPLFPWLPILAIICQGVLAVFLIHMSWIAWIVAPVWVGGGLAIYWYYSRHHALPSADEIRVLEENDAPESDHYRILVSVANTENALKMVRTTYLISEAKDARVKLLHMVPVPEQVSLTDAEKFAVEGREGIMEAMMYFVMKFPIDTTIRYCRNIARGILSAVKEKKTDLLIMGWHGKPRGQGFRLGSIVDTMLERSPSKVVVLKNFHNNPFKRILIPWGGGPHADFALELANIFAERDDSEITVFAVNSSNRIITPDQLLEDVKNRTSLDTSRIKAKCAANHSVTDAIIKESDNHDLMIIGSTRDPLLYQAARDSISHTVACQAQKPTMIIKTSGKWTAWIKRWI